MALMDLQDFWGLAEANAGQRAEEEGAVRMGDPGMGDGRSNNGQQESRSGPAGVWLVRPKQLPPSQRARVHGTDT
ncbi:hypothetical protein PABG_11502 [Paracoccidioides brasiliensis Pb03]|nr:hypothetical protein PABG_11502 [Paracoccidioides brasiliensis Pb03]